MWGMWGSRGLMDRALDLKPGVTQGCGFESRLWQEVSMTGLRPLSKAPNLQHPLNCLEGFMLKTVKTLCVCVYNVLYIKW